MYGDAMADPKRATEMLRGSETAVRQSIGEFPRAVGDVPRKRRCLACGDTFYSEGWSNRMCKRCRKRSAP